MIARRTLLRIAAAAGAAPFAASPGAGAVATPVALAPAVAPIDATLIGTSRRWGMGADRVVGSFDQRRDGAGRRSAEWFDFETRACPGGAVPLAWVLGLMEEQAAAWCRDRAAATA